MRLPDLFRLPARPRRIRRPPHVKPAVEGLEQRLSPAISLNAGIVPYDVPSYAGVGFQRNVIASLSGLNDDGARTCDRQEIAGDGGGTGSNGERDGQAGTGGEVAPALSAAARAHAPGIGIIRIPARAVSTTSR